MLQSTSPAQIRSLRESDLVAADRIFRLAFGTFLGLKEPMTFSGDADYVRTRWLADPRAALGAEIDGKLVGSNFATRWGSVGFFGPLSVDPQLWDRGIAVLLMKETMKIFEKWGTRHDGLFTFGHSPKHLGLYQKFGFWPRFLTAIMSRPVGTGLEVEEWSRYSELPERERVKALKACREIANSIFEGLDLEREILAVEKQKLGETLLLSKVERLTGFAVCHCGPGTEAGSGTCYVKFGGVRSSTTAGGDFERLLQACEELAVFRGMSRLVAGANMGRHEAYQIMLRSGFKTDFLGVAMHRPSEPGYSGPNAYVIDDWR